MTFIDTVMLYFSTIACALLLITGGWAKIRNWFKAHEQAKVDAAEAAAKSRADEIEAEVQKRLKESAVLERLKKLNDAVAAEPEGTATSTTGPVVAG